jgi:hypothetical protein
MRKQTKETDQDEISGKNASENLRHNQYEVAGRKSDERWGHDDDGD